jgi:hypothetical protein
LIEVAKAVIPKDNFNKAIGKIQKVLIDDVSLFKEIKAESATAKETKAINELQIKVMRLLMLSLLTQEKMVT